MANLKNTEIAAGFPAGDAKGAITYPNGASVLQIAAWNNRGTKNIPARPFMHEAEWFFEADAMGNGAEIAKNIINGVDSVEQGAKQIGLAMEDAIRTAIDSTILYVPNAPLTVKRKNSSKPLFDTGQMRGAVSSVVRQRSTDAD